MRACACGAVVQVPSDTLGATDDRHSFPSGVVVDVYVVHLSLSERARTRGVVEMWDFIERTSVGDVRVSELCATCMS